MLATSANSAGTSHRLVRKRKLVEGMSGFVQQRVDVTVRIGGIHENEGEAAFVKTDLVTAGGFP